MRLPPECETHPPTTILLYYYIMYHYNNKVSCNRFVKKTHCHITMRFYFLLLQHELIFKRDTIFISIGVQQYALIFIFVNLVNVTAFIISKQVIILVFSIDPPCT